MCSLDGAQCAPYPLETMRDPLTAEFLPLVSTLEATQLWRCDDGYAAGAMNAQFPLSVKCGTQVRNGNLVLCLFLEWHVWCAFYDVSRQYLCVRDQGDYFVDAGNATCTAVACRNESVRTPQYFKDFHVRVKSRL